MLHFLSSRLTSVWSSFIPAHLSCNNLDYLKFLFVLPTHMHYLQTYRLKHTCWGGGDQVINFMAIPPPMDGKGECECLCSIFAKLTSVVRDCSTPTHAVNPHTPLHTPYLHSLPFSPTYLPYSHYMHIQYIHIHTHAYTHMCPHRTYSHNRHLKANSVCLMELVIYPLGALLI